MVLYIGVLNPIKADSITVVFRGMKPGDKFKIYYNSVPVKKVNCMYDHCVNFRINVVDSQINKTLPISIYRKGRFWISYRNTEVNPVFFEKKEFIIFYNNKRLKRRHYIDYVWSDHDWTYE
jgi:hypothetical protein